MRPLRISSTSGSRSGSSGALLEERDEAPHRRMHPCRAGAELRAAQVARLRREHELDRDHARAQLGHLVESPAPRAAPSSCDPRSPPPASSRRGRTRPAGRGAAPRQRSTGPDAVLAERALGHVRLRAESVSEPGQVLLQHLHAALGRRRDRRREGEPGDVERGRERLHLEVADREDTILVDERRAGSTEQR